MFKITYCLWDCKVYFYKIQHVKSSVGVLLLENGFSVSFSKNIIYKLYPLKNLHYCAINIYEQKLESES